MKDLAEFRQAYPMYNDMDDATLADRIHRKFYSDLPREQVFQRLGVDPSLYFPEQGEMAGDPSVTRAPIPAFLKEHGQGMLDAGVQGGMTVAGTAAGVPFGPAGMITGGAAGSVAGRRMARDIGYGLGLKGSEEYPTGGESTLDAAAGAAGPVVSAVAKPAARAFTSIPRKTVELGHKAEDAAMKSADAFATKYAKGGIDPTKPGSTLKDPHFVKMQNESAAAAEAFIKAREAGFNAIGDRVGNLAKRAGEFGSLGTLIATGDFTGAMGLLAGGLAVAKVQQSVARRLLANDDFFYWAIEKGPGPNTAKQVATQLAALAASETIKPETRRDINKVIASLPAESAQARINRTRTAHWRKQTRNPDTGRFSTSGTLSRPSPEELDGGPL